MFRSLWVLGLLAVCAPFASACRNEARRDEQGAAARKSEAKLTKKPGPARAEPKSSNTFSDGNSSAGEALVAKFECSRCHDGTPQAAAPGDKHCVHCHQDILAGKFKGPPAKLEKWQRNVAWVRDIPSLASLGQRLKPAWVESFLLEPHDLRPNLAQTMPRLKLTRAEAHDIVTYLTAQRPPLAATSFEATDSNTGRELLENKGCGSCHVFSGVPPLLSVPNPKSAAIEQKRAISLAPDLRHARERFRPDQIVRWIIDPKSIKPDTLMTPSPVSSEEARALAGYILNTPLALPERKARPARLPPLMRKVSFEEVYERVLSKTCRHCHSDPDIALGDGGPGNTGGFGFLPRGLNLATYAGVASGFLAEKRERTSVFTKLSDGTPRLVAALLARQAEEAGMPNPEVRGMPLSLPALVPEDVQLVETWIAQGRPR